MVKKNNALKAFIKKNTVSHKELEDRYFGKSGSKSRDLYEDYVTDQIELIKEHGEIEELLENFNPYKNNTSVQDEYIKYVTFCLDGKLTPVKYDFWEQKQKLNEAKHRYPVGTEFTSSFGSEGVVKKDSTFFMDGNDVFVSSGSFGMGDERLIYDGGSWARIHSDKNAKLGLDIIDMNITTEGSDKEVIELAGEHGGGIIKVCQEVYYLPREDGKQILMDLSKEWFKDRLRGSHAYRDGSEFVTNILKVEIIRYK